jgi:hypothetical protein
MKKGWFGVGGFSVVLLSAASAFAYTYTTQVTMKFANDVGPANNSGTLVIGNSTGRQLAFDDNEIQGRAANGGPSVLYLQHAGGELRVGGAMTVDGDLDLSEYRNIYSAGTNVVWFNNAGNGSRVMHFTAPMQRFYGDVEFETDQFTVDSAATFQSDITLDGHLYVHQRPVEGGALCLSYGATNIREIGYCSSSRRYKTDIQTLRSGLKDVMAMRPVSYAWKESGVHSVGFIAEEVDAVRPELVLRDERGEVQSFNYQHYTAVLTRAVQEQQGELEELRQRLSSSHAELRQVAETVAQRDRALSEQQAKLASQGVELAALRAQMAELARSLSRLEATSTRR